MLMLALVCALFSACATEALLPTEPAAPTPAQEPEAAPTPAPTPEPDADALCTMCRDGFLPHSRRTIRGMIIPPSACWTCPAL